MKLAAPALLAASLVAIGCGTNSLPPVANDFTLTITPTEQTLVLAPDGGTTASTETYTVTSAISAGVAEAVTLAVSGLPSGVTGALDPTEITGAGTSTLTLTVPASQPAANSAFTVTGTALSGTHDVAGTLDVCIPGAVTLAVTQTDLYTCTNQSYMANFTVTNGTCSPLTVTEIDLTGTIDPNGSAQNCSGSGLSTYPLHTVIAAGASKNVLPLTGNPYCCSSTPCPDFTCVESYAYQAVTTAGTVTAAAQEATIHLAENAPDGGCPVDVCN